MAQTIGCDLCQQEPAVMMQSNLAKGDTISVGETCMVTFFAASLTAMLGGATPIVLNDLAPVLTQLAAVIGPGEWHTQSEADQSEADPIAAGQSDAMMAEE